MRRLTCIAAAALALALPGAATAYTLDDVRALGYQVALAFVRDSGCTVYTVTGYGVYSLYLDECDAGYQAAVDSIASPNGHYERRWQYEHPDQLQGAQTLASHCYSVNRTAAMTDSWRILGGVTDVTVPGAELPTLAGSLPDLRLPDGSCPAGTGGSTIIPNTEQDGSITFPGSPGAIQSAEQTALASWQAYADQLAAAGYDIGLVTPYGVEIRPSSATRCAAI